jgi:hypothetical protein
MTWRYVQEVTHKKGDSTGPVASPLLLLSIRAGIGFAKKI